MKYRDKEIIRYGFSPIAEKISFPSPSFLDHSKFAENTISGEAFFKILTIDPLHIGSGLYELSEYAGLAEGYVVLGIFKKDGCPIIPGSSIKGASRSVYEAITKSCISKLSRKTSEKISSNWRNSKIPQMYVTELLSRGARDGSKVNVSVADSEPKGAQSCKEIKSSEHLRHLCPACALYGGMGFMGRVFFSDALPDKLVPKDPNRKLSTETQNSPHLHKTGKIKIVGKSIQVKEIRGRKFYYHSDRIIEDREPIDYIPKGSSFIFKLVFTNLTREELGGLFVSLSMDDSFYFKLGGKKASGFGGVKFSLEKIHFFSDKEFYLGYDSKGRYLEKTDDIVKNAMHKFKNSAWFHKYGYDAVVSITTNFMG
jgi:CRISPR/Cas system CSM-associated protein Csm3 (group 7 of RAMP superfamily)